MLPRDRLRDRLVLVLGVAGTAALVGLVVIRGQGLARWRDTLGERFAAEHLVPAVSVETDSVIVGDLALSPTGGPARIQKLWIPRQEPAGDDSVLSWDQVRLVPTLLGLVRAADPPARIEVRGLRLDLSRGSGALAALRTLHRLLPAPARVRAVAAEITSGTVRLSLAPGDRPDELDIVRGRAGAAETGGWEATLDVRSRRGEPARLHLATEGAGGTLTRVRVGVELDGRRREIVLPAPDPAGAPVAPPARCHPPGSPD